GFEMEALLALLDAFPVEQFQWIAWTTPAIDEMACASCECGDAWCIEVLIGTETTNLNVTVGDFVAGANRIESERISVPSQAIGFTVDFLGDEFLITQAVMTTIVINGGACGSPGVSDRENYVRLLLDSSVVAENIVMVNQSCRDF